MDNESESTNSEKAAELLDKIYDLAMQRDSLKDQLSATNTILWAMIHRVYTEYNDSIVYRDISDASGLTKSSLDKILKRERANAR